jgi:hypothetical protein
VLTRGETESRGLVRFEKWDGKTAEEWAHFLDHACAVINLTGKTINCRHTPENRREILESRVNSVHALGQAIGQCARPPRVFVQASGIGIYPDSRNAPYQEDSPHGAQFEAEVCEAWERALAEVNPPSMRKVVLRIAAVLGKEGGLLQTLAPLTRWFMGGQIGDGGQIVSWIHQHDLTSMFASAVDNDRISGVFNACSPNPVSNAELMKELRRALQRPWSPPVPKFAARIGASLMGTEASLALSSHRCIPKRFNEQGFQFSYPQLRDALAEIYQTP